MDNCRIVVFNDFEREGVKAYMRKVFPAYPLPYIDYCLDHSADRTPSILVINGEGDVVGCHQYFCTKALLNSEEIETQWGHDTILDQEYRKEAGVDFLLVRKKIPAFGLGLTETNAKMRKLMKSVFLNGVFNYYTLTPYAVLSPFQKLLKTKKTIMDISIIKSGNKQYKRVHSANEIPIPNQGYWYKGYNELDFIRDEAFLNQRFFNCKVHDYRVYASKDSYFVVREASYRGMPAVMLSDFRYNPADKSSAQTLMKAVRKLARKSGYGIVYFVCGDKNIEAFIRRKLHYKTHMDFISSYKISPDTTFSLTGGDSDAEFLKA